jgi:hypothetical protein
MITNKYYSTTICTLFVLLITFNNMYAQNKKNITITAGINYQNNMQYVGRTDSVITPLVTPNLRLSLKNGFYAEGEMYFNTNDHKIDGGYISAGYEYDGKNWGTGIDLSKYFFNSQSTIIKSDISTSLGAYLYYDTKFVTLNVEPNYDFGSNGDFVIGAGLSKDISFDNLFKNGNIKITPKFYDWMGTQSFAQNHTIEINNGNGKGKGNNPTVSTTQNNSFEQLSLEVSLPVELTIKKHFKLSATPLLSFPKNVNQLGGWYASSNYPKSIFIFTTGIAYTF